MKKFVQKLRSKKGFTLIELIVVIAILGILVLLAAPRFLGYTKDANVSTMQADAKTLSSAALIFNIENEEWPIALEGEEGSKVPVEITDKAINVQTSDTVYKLDKERIGKTTGEKFQNQIQSIKGKYSDYGIVISGENEGTVYHLNGVEDRNGITHFGVALDDKADPVDGE